MGTETKRIIPILRVLFVISFVVFPIGLSAYQNEADGFRGIKWGTDISTQKGMTHVRTDPSFGGIEMYIRDGDDLHIGGATLEKIEYGFWKGKFTVVWIKTHESTNYIALRDATFAKFGKGYQSNEYIEQYVWGGSVTGMLLEYNEISEVGTLMIASKAMQKQEEEYDRQKAQEGVEKGF